MAKQLAGSGHNITMITTRYGASMTAPVDLGPADHISLIELPYMRLPYFKSFLPIPARPFRLNRIFKSADVIYFDNVVIFLELALLAVKLIYKKPVINMYQVSLYAPGRLRRLYQYAVSRFAARFFDAQHVLNEADRQVLIKWKAKNIRYIPNGVAVDEFMPPEMLSQEKFDVLFVGRLNLSKGFDILCVAIEILNGDKKFADDAGFTIIGGGPLEFRAGQLKSFGNVRHYSRIEHAGLPDRYARASVLAAPFRREGMPLVALEAQSAGLPIVAFDIPGLRGLASENRSVELVKPEDPRAFAKAIYKCYDLWKNQKDVYGELRRLARKNTQDKYSWDKIAAMALEVINSV
jgi:glycosyltransferase involved in cell wall biosynthesis